MASRVRLVEMAGEIARRLDRFQRTTMEGAEIGVRLVMDGMEAKAVELAPVDKGNLEASTVVDVYADSRRVAGRLAFTAPYAAEVHELPPDARGPKTRQKPGNELGPAGPKYLERVLRAYQRTAARSVGEALQKIWKKGR